MADASPAANGGKPPKKKINMSRAWAEARGLLWAHRKSLALGLGIMLVQRLAGFVAPYSSKYLIDHIIGEHHPERLVPLALAVAGATVVGGITSFALSQIVSVAGQRAIADLRTEVEAHILHLPVSYFDSTKSGVLISRIMSDPEGIRNLVGTGLIQLTGGTLAALGAIGMLFWLNWQLTSAMLVIILGFGGMMAYAFRRLRPIFRARQEINAEVTGRLAESLGGIRTLKIYTAEAREEARFAAGVDRLFTNIAQTITGTSAVTAGATVITGLVSVVLIVLGGRAIIAGTMTLGDLIWYLLLIAMVVAPVVQVASISTQISEAFAGLDRIREIREMATEDQEDASRTPLPDVEGRVEFDHVSFEYVPGVPVLRDVSLTVRAGSTTALVGPSGSGKSTLISLVMAFNRPGAGYVRVDGHDLGDVRLRDYRSRLGVVMQDNFLFDGTVRENISFAKPDATDAEVRAVSRIAHCDEFIERFPQGYDTIVGERGVKLSGGQRQRVAIARAILADPRILILDEATSSLDSESEALIRDGLHALRQGRTTFVIAHRLSTIESADQILVLDGGRIVERGNHQELIALGKRYKQLYDKHYGIEHDRFINPGEDPTPQSPSPRDGALAGARRSRGPL